MPYLSHPRSGSSCCVALEWTATTRLLLVSEMRWANHPHVIQYCSMPHGMPAYMMMCIAGLDLLFRQHAAHVGPCPMLCSICAWTSYPITYRMLLLHTNTCALAVQADHIICHASARAFYSALHVKCTMIGMRSLS